MTSTTTTTMRRRGPSTAVSSCVDGRVPTIAPISGQARHAALGARPISVSSPVRSAPATGPGMAPSSPSAGRAIDGVTMRGQLPDARDVATCPVRVGVGEVVRVDQRVDGSAPTARQRAGDRVVDADQSPGGSGTSPAQAVVGCHHRMVKGFNEIRGEPTGHRQRHRRHPREHGGLHAAAPAARPATSRTAARRRSIRSP